MEIYDFPPFRPPSEAESLLLRVTRGCPWNKCTFCKLYKNLPFERKPLEEIKKEIKLAKLIYGSEVETAFIGDSNSILIKGEELVDILKYLYHIFPKLKRVTSYARAKTILKKPLKELKEIRKAGLNRLHIGLETGDDQLLKEVKKGATAKEMMEAGKRAKEAGFELSLYVILGLGGKEGWLAHARETAKVINQIDPDFIRMRTLVLLPGMPLYEEREEGRFRPSSPLETLKEERVILQDLEVNSEFLSDHVSNYLPVEGKLPEDKKRMLEELDIIIEALERAPGLKEQILQPEYLRRL